MDWTQPIGVDLTRDPVVTKTDRGLLHEWPGCRVLVPEALGKVEVATPKPNGCRSHHGANQDPVEAILDALWPRLAECRTAKELGAAILAAGVDPKLKHALGRAARDRLGKEWTDKTVRFWLAPASHTKKRAERNHEAKRVWHANPVNAERNREASRAWRADPINAERNRKACRDWRVDNPDYQNAYQKARLQADPVFALAIRLRTRLAQAVRLTGTGKSAGTFDLVGCTSQELKAHIEAQFVDGMTWENRDKWHVDHVRPLASFDLTDPEQQRQAMHFSNIAPVWATDNRVKSSHHNGRKWRHSDHT